jgi:hypothetical protein
MTIQAPRIQWPLRDRWAALRQPHPDGLLPVRPSAFASSTEINNLIRALERLRDTQAGVAKRRVTEAIKKLRNDTFPYISEVPEAKQLVAPLHCRRRNAHELHKQAWSRHRDDQPVDDAAWEAELQRRAAIESEFAAAWAERMKLEAEKEAA